MTWGRGAERALDVPATQLRVARRGGLLGCLVIAWLLLTALSAEASTGTAPIIIGTSVTPTSSTTAKVEVTVNPGGVKTIGAIELFAQTPPGYFGEATSLPAEQVIHGEIAAGSPIVAVTGTFTKLTEGLIYFYTVHLENKLGGSVHDEVPYSFGFGTPDDFPEGTAPPMPSHTEYALWVSWIAEREGEEIIREYEAQQRKEAEEHAAREAERAAEVAAGERYNEEHERIYLEEQARDHPTPSVAHCLVPKVQRQSLPAATRAIKKAGCRLGRVRRPHASYRGALVVVRQTPAHGQRVALDTAVTLTLGPAPAPRKHP